jgi:hypothetical protein
MKINEEQFGTLQVPNTIGFRTGLYEFVGKMNILIEDLNRNNFAIEEFYLLEANLTIMLQGKEIDYELINYTKIKDMNSKIEKFLKNVGKDSRNDMIQLNKLFKNNKEVEGFYKRVNESKLTISTINRIMGVVKNIDLKMSSIEESVEDGKMVLIGIAVKNIRKSLELLAVYTTNITKVMVLVNHMFDMIKHIDRTVTENRTFFSRVSNEEDKHITKDNSPKWILNQEFYKEGMTMRDLDSYLKACDMFLQGMNISTPSNLEFLNSLTPTALTKYIMKRKELVEPFSKRLLTNMKTFEELLEEFEGTITSLEKDEVISDSKSIESLSTNNLKPFCSGYNEKEIRITLTSLADVQQTLRRTLGGKKFPYDDGVERGPFPINDNLKNNNLISYIRKTIRIHQVFHDNILPIEVLISNLLEDIVTDLVEDKV